MLAPTVLVNIAEHFKIGDFSARVSPTRITSNCNEDSRLQLAYRYAYNCTTWDSLSV